MQSPIQSILSLGLPLRLWLKILSNLLIRVGSEGPMGEREENGVVDGETSGEGLFLILLVFGRSLSLLLILSGE